MYLSNSLLISYFEEKVNEFIIIYDEIDCCFHDSIALINKVNDKNILKNHSLTLKKFKSVIGFTGALSDSTTKHIKAC
jgi:hypothetical protein